MAISNAASWLCLHPIDMLLSVLLSPLPLPRSRSAVRDLFGIARIGLLAMLFLLLPSLPLDSLPFLVLSALLDRSDIIGARPSKALEV